MAKYPESLDRKAAPTEEAWMVALSRTPPAERILRLMVVLLAATVLCPYVVITVPSGHVGVLWKRFNGFGFGLLVLCWPRHSPGPPRTEE